MATSKVNLISLAITLLGHTPISSLDDGDNMVISAEQAYDMLLPASIAANNWRFATQIQQLSQVNATPPTPWVAIYNLPAGWLKTIRVWPQTYAWDIYANSQIFTQFQGDWWMEYTYLPDTSKLPAHFVKYFIYELATYLAMSNAQQMSYYDRVQPERDKNLAMCAAIEAQNRPNFTQVNFPVLDNRELGGFIPNSING